MQELQTAEQRSGWLVIGRSANWFLNLFRVYHLVAMRSLSDGLRSRRWLLLLLFLLGALWHLTPVALQGASCSKRDTALCHDHGVGDLRRGRDHIVCVYADRVVKTVRAYVETKACMTGRRGQAAEWQPWR